MGTLIAILLIGAALYMVSRTLRWVEETAIPVEPKLPLVHLAFRPCDLPELDFRPYEASDADFCFRLYHDLQGARLAPAGHEDAFSSWLQSDETPKWIISSASRRLACCGMSTTPADHCSAMSFGLMDLDHRKRGLGSLSLALRLWMLMPQQAHFVYLWATDHSNRYYQRFGFTAGLDETETFDDLTFLGLYLRPEDNDFLDHYLRGHFADLPQKPG